MKLPKSVLAAVVTGVTIVAVSTSCTKEEIRIADDERVIEEAPTCGFEEVEMNSYEDCPACGLG